MASLWALINGMQLIVHQCMYKIKIPANAEDFNAAMITIANFEVLPADDINEYIFYVPEIEAEPFNENFAVAEYDSVHAVYNLGSIFYILVFHVLLLVAWSFLGIITKLAPSSRTVRKRFNELHDYLFWNGL